MPFLQRAAGLMTLVGCVTGLVVATPARAALPEYDELMRTAATGDQAATGFASLADAVVAQSLPSDVSEDLECLAGAIFYEAKGEPLAGQLAVAGVILNRAKSGRYPPSICGVVTQHGQFAFVRGGAIPAVDPDRADYRVALAVARVALGNGWDSPAPQALFFHARYVAPRWAKTRVAAIGNHVFYR